MDKVDKELSEIYNALLKLKESAKENNISDDDIETELLCVLELAGIVFSR